MRIPNSPSRGDVITADHMRAISDAIRDLYAKLGVVSNNRYRPILGAGGGTVCTSLLPFLVLDGAAWKLSISAGFSTSEIPDFSGGNLADLSPPTATIAAATKLWMVIEWTPGSDNDGAGLHWITSGGTMSAADFVVSATRPSETAAVVAEDGTVTNGVYAFLWAEIISDGDGGYLIAANRCGSHQAVFCQPNSLTLIFG